MYQCSSTGYYQVLSLYGETTLNPLESHQTFVTHFAQTSPRNASKCEEIPQHSSPLALAFAFFPSLPSPLRHSLLYSPLFGRAVFQYLTFYPPLSPPPPFDTNPSHPLPLPLPPYHLDLFSSSPSHHHHLYSRRLIYSIRLIIIFSTNLPILPLVTIEQQSRVPFLSRAALGPVREILTRHSRLPRTTRLDSTRISCALRLFAVDSIVSVLAWPAPTSSPCDADFSSSSW